MTNNDTMPTFAVQPAAWNNFDSYGCDWSINISHAYKICSIWQEMNHAQGDMMIWRVTPGGEPVRWVRVYADETVDVATLSEQELDLLTIDKW